MRTTRPNTSNADPLTSDGAPLGVPPSSTPYLSAANAPISDEPDEIRAIWGTTVNINQTIQLFTDFLKNFKVKYRVAYNRENGIATPALATPEEGEALLYEGYLRRMRQTNETNLNLDIRNLLAYPPAKKLHIQVIKYPQEVIPTFDQALKDVMIELAEQDQAAGMEGMEGTEGDVEISDILGKVYKVRPLGLTPVNMRDLNPSGE